MAAMIGIDWGTSNLRAMLYDGSGTVREERSRPWGIRRLPAGGFGAALANVCAGWPQAPVLACGMVGSRQGWHEVGYVDAPASLQMLARHTVSIGDGNDRPVRIIPGVRDSDGPDVMRGEETQILGALAQHPELAARVQMILPGTHTKWVDTVDNQITHFCTLMTGELYGLLQQHSILAASMPSGVAGADAPGAFAQGVRAARASGNAGALTRLFSTRVLQLEAQLEPAAVPSYLSGLLIGEEWRAMLASEWLHLDYPLVLVGDAAQCQRYARAAALFDMAPPQVVTGAAASGLWCIGNALAQSPAARIPADGPEYEA